MIPEKGERKETCAREQLAGGCSGLLWRQVSNLPASWKFALTEAVLAADWQTLQLVGRHRRDLVTKAVQLKCQIQEHLDAAFFDLFPILFFPQGKEPVK